MLVVAAPVGACFTWILTEPDAKGGSPAPDERLASSFTGEKARTSVKHVEPLNPTASNPLEPYTVIGAGAQIYDGLTFGPEGAARTRLAGLVGPRRDSVCQDGEKRLWACGLQARAALNNLIRRSRIACTPVQPVLNNILEANCSVDGRDLGLDLVSAGFARSATPSQNTASLETDAASQQRGLWNGGWTIRR